VSKKQIFFAFFIKSGAHASKLLHSLEAPWHNYLSMSAAARPLVAFLRSIGAQALRGGLAKKLFTFHCSLFPYFPPFNYLVNSL
jgi:hypothetical protein